ncbi:hypothetical protein [Mycobacterium sp.]|nr:hypothetical protein [Mycobacterium sp.]HKP39861.1 hypothetical protein [Mycobacterium sp.]
MNTTASNIRSVSARRNAFGFRVLAGAILTGGFALAWCDSDY